MKPPETEAEEFRRHAHRVVDWIADYWSNVPRMPVAPQLKPGDVRGALPPAAPEQAEDFGDVLRDFQDIVVPGLTHWQHPSFFGYFPANTSGPSILGDLLSAGVNVQGMLWSTSPACTELEATACEWLRQLLGLPERFQDNGVIQDTATTAMLMAMVAALNRAGGTSWRLDGDTRRYTCYTSDQANVMVQRVCRTVGIGDRRLRRIATDPATLAMNPRRLAEAVERDLSAGYVPLAVIATVGTTSTAAVDPLSAIGEVCASHGIWLHVDAAYAGAAAVCPEMRWINDGSAAADSYSTSPHKWLLTGFDCSVLWLADPAALLRATSACADYLDLGSEEGRIDYGNWQLPLGRRFRALKLWSVMRCYGAEGLRQHIRRSIALASRLCDQLAGDDRFEVLVPQHFGLVCFRLRAGAEATERLLERVNASRQAFLTSTRVHGQPALRFAAGGTLTREEHVDRAWQLLRDSARHLADALPEPQGDPALRNEGEHR